MRVTFVVPYAGGIVRGGLEIQADKTRAALAARGVEVDLLTPQTRTVGDLVHFFGTFDYYATLGADLVRRGIPYVCSPVFLPKDTGTKLRLSAYRKRLLTHNFPRGQRRLYRQAALLITLSRKEEDNLRAFFGERLPPLARVPNGVDSRFFEADPAEARRELALPEEFVLSTGRIEPRKNQLALIQALKGTGVRMAFAGPVGDPSYYEECRSQAVDAVFLRDLPFEGSLLPSLYAAAKVFALPSHMEVLSLSALEAAAAGARLVLSNTWGAEEHFAPDAVFVSPTSQRAIREAVLSAMAQPRPGREQSDRFRERYSWDAVAALVHRQYERALGHTGTPTPILA
jgi:glycosyltransferase involved in cell wall biosynthesis